jgi:hypothetical protein
MYGAICGLDPPAGPKPLRRGEGPRIHHGTEAMDGYFNTKFITQTGV